ncbi:hypothetical protein NEPAR06_0505 [Nematocida parisii]|uniref:uncharacterized protein n=1 Tax=Nematocida parisii (strain ERTm1 / ATCC PRA-289) TaxID=881290 RepID=UPI000264BAD6|nr:uncharacterized protein NEPG_01124 [Nematocida parisii ERTm1]EIJ94456.1 hypothetical protein NEPG_01124 [Nematocida parisii ERTm1]KAI5142577.1 hypothetical protein NEPAR07_0182 [Nematocida parisii]KAI5153505.1 hypothetical protein NEPAR06_0505 [Nematocida parisii]KAI5156928.1 hypothetical protein NEPAR05_0911 [Nematocida parisii]|eukprot:XP_013058952.1 hypothetical protein NEPG_01124 [Nematocida parisii ERTm1]
MDITQKPDTFSANTEELKTMLGSKSTENLNSKDKHNPNKISNRRSLTIGIATSEIQLNNYKCKKIPCTEEDCERCEWAEINHIYASALTNYCGSTTNSTISDSHAQEDQESNIVDVPTSTNFRVKHRLSSYIYICLLGSLLIIIIIIIVISCTAKPSFVLHL